MVIRFLKFECILHINVTIEWVSYSCHFIVLLKHAEVMESGVNS